MNSELIHAAAHQKPTPLQRNYLPIKNALLKKMLVLSFFLYRNLSLQNLGQEMRQTARPKERKGFEKRI